MSIAKVISITGILSIFVLVTVLYALHTIPVWLFRTTYICFLGALWVQLMRMVYQKMNRRQQGWFLFWNYVLPWLAVGSIAAGYYTEESFGLRLSARLVWSVSSGCCIALIYNFSYKNKQKMRKKIVAGNWKMNTLPAEGVGLVKEIAAGKGSVCSCVNFIVCPPFTHISEVVKAVKGSGIAVGAQNCAAEAKGAYTGEIAASMIAALGCEYVILGHSERRQYYGETSEILNKKLEQAYANNLVPIYCVGENLTEREADKHFDVVKAQIEEVVYNLTTEQFTKLVIAYEPVWAIGTGKTASAEQAQEIHAYIRKVLTAKFGVAAQQTAILYGGSCKPSNAAEIFAKEDVDGGLIGGASLVAADFLGIGKGFAN